MGFSHTCQAATYTSGIYQIGMLFDLCVSVCLCNRYLHNNLITRLAQQQLQSLHQLTYL